MRTYNLESIEDVMLKNILINISKSIQKYEDYDIHYNFSSNRMKNTLNCDVIVEIQNWAFESTDIGCKKFLSEIYKQKGITVGDFSRAILKISAIVKELINVSVYENFSELQFKLSKIDELLLKFVCTNQSLYI
jgi:hypothetical protein